MDTNKLIKEVDKAIIFILDSLRDWFKGNNNKTPNKGINNNKAIILLTLINFYYTLII